jgi:bacteriorhodopsin
MNRDNKTNNLSRGQKLDFLGDIVTLFVCILISIWTSFQIVYLIRSNMNAILLYIVYGVFDIFCLAAFVAIGKKLLRAFSRQCRHQGGRENH